MTRESWIRTPSSPIPMDTRAFFPKSTSSHWYCLPLLSSIPEESRASFLAGFCRLSIHQSLESCGEAGWNQSTHIKKEYSSKMEHSYYQKWNTRQNGTLLLLSKWNTHQNGTLILSKWNSSKWNTHIIIKMELIKMETLILKIANMYHGMRTLIWNSPHQHALDYREEPWILIK